MGCGIAFKKGFVLPVSLVQRKLTKLYLSSGDTAECCFTWAMPQILHCNWRFGVIINYLTNSSSCRLNGEIFYSCFPLYKLDTALSKCIYHWLLWIGDFCTVFISACKGLCRTPFVREGCRLVTSERRLRRGMWWLIQCLNFSARVASDWELLSARESLKRLEQKVSVVGHVGLW